jgi:hypothetical protein
MFLGFPPPDNVIRDLLTKCDEIGMLHFLIVLFERTTAVITNDLKEARSRSERITKFREFMKEGQSMAGVGEKRQDFYDEIAATVQAVSQSTNHIPFSYILQRITSEATCLNVWHALETLINHLGPRPQSGPGTDDLPDVFVVFDEVHSLMVLKNLGAKRTCFIELCSVLNRLKNFPLFSFFLSTSGKILQSTLPKDIDPSNMVQPEKLSLPFSDLGFDHLMCNHKIFDKYKTIDEVTSTECVMHMGRPL